MRPTFHWVDDVIDPETIEITLRFDVSAPAPETSGGTTPTATAHRPLTVVGGGLNLVPFPFAGLADDDDTLQTLLAGSSHPIKVDELAIDWAAQAAIVVSIGEDLCPSVLDRIDVAGGVATPVFVSAGYLMCEAPLLSYTVIAAVDRDELAGVTQLHLPSDLMVTDVDTVVDVSVARANGDPSVVPIVADFGECSGSVPLPPRGEVVSGRLDDGTPVFVVHHHGGTVSALDPRGADQSVPGLYQVVRWVAATRNFLGHGAWDEYGRRLDGFRASDLRGYATRVSDGNVEIGSLVPAPSGSPITSTDRPPAMTDRSVEVDQLLEMTSALDLTPGTTAWIDGVVYATPDGARVCTEQGSMALATTPITVAPGSIGCPAGSPVAFGIAGTPGSVSYFVGPLLATRTEDGFELIAATGGYGSFAL